MSAPFAWLDAHLLRHAGAAKDYKAEWGWMRYQVGGKMFAAICTPGAEHRDYAGHTLLNLKCDPLMAEHLQTQYTAIRPGFYMDKRHWIAVLLDSDLPEELLRGLCDQSYRLVLEKLPKKLQKELAQHG